MANAVRGVMIVGGNGFVGTHLALKLREGYRVVTTFNRQRTRLPGVLSLPLDFREEAWTKTLLYRFRPEVIIYLSGPQDFDWIDRNLTAAEKIIANGPAEILRIADIFQPRVIYLSTPYVFDGSKGNYLEKDSLAPYNNFGKLKAGAENFLRGRATSFTVIRSSPLLGCSVPEKPSFLDQVRFSLARGQRVELQNYELHSFGSISMLADLVDRVISSAPKKGLFHFGGLTKLTHYELAVRFAKRFDLDPKLLVPNKKSPGKYSLATETNRTDFSLNFSEAVQHFQLDPLEADEILENLQL